MKTKYTMNHDLTVVTRARLEDMGFSLPQGIGLVRFHKAWNRIGVQLLEGPHANSAYLKFVVVNFQQPNSPCPELTLRVSHGDSYSWVGKVQNWVCREVLPAIYPETTIETVRRYNLV